MGAYLGQILKELVNTGINLVNLSYKNVRN
jgi:hypothetical protein